MLRRMLLALLCLGLATLPAFAEHADITLSLFRADADTGRPKGEVQAKADHEPPAGGVKRRPLFKAKAGEALTLQFVFVNTYPHDVTRDVKVRYFVVREDKLKQAAVPELDNGVITQGEFTLNFRPKSRVGARVVFTAPTAGAYLVRVDSANTHSDHEHFAALDLLVE